MAPGLSVLMLVALVAMAAALAVWSASLGTDGLQSAAARWGVWSPLAFAGVYVAATLLVVPKNVLTIGAGLVFGFGFGSALVWVAALAGAVTGRRPVDDEIRLPECGAAATDGMY